MANPILQLIVTARDEASSVLRRIFGAMRGSASDAESTFSKLFKSLNDNTNVVASYVRETFSNLFGGAVDSAAEYEAQLSKIIAKGDDTYKNSEKLSEGIKNVAAAFGVTGLEAAQGMETLAAAGLTATDALNALPSVMALAKIEGISLDDAAMKLSDSLSIVGLGFDQAARMANVLAKGANITTSSAAQLAEALSTAGGIAKTAGLDLETTVAALDLLHKNGIKGSAAGTALSAVLSQLTNPTSTASKALSALGITSRDLGTVLDELKRRGAVANDAIAAFGETAGPGLRALITEGQTGLQDYTAQLRDSEGAAMTASKAMGDNFASAWKALASSWESLKTALAEPILKPFTIAARELADTFNNTLKSGAIKPLQEAIGEFATKGIEAVKQFITGFDFRDAKKAAEEFTRDAITWVKDIKTFGTDAAASVAIAWNSVTVSIRSAALVIKTLNPVEYLKGYKVAVQEFKLSYEGIQQDVADIKAAYDKLNAATTQQTDTAKTAAIATQELTARNKELKESVPVEEPQTAAMAIDALKVAAQQANNDLALASKMFAEGKISAGVYGENLIAASKANQTLDAAIKAQTDSTKKQTDGQKDQIDQSVRLRNEMQARQKQELDAIELAKKKIEGQKGVIDADIAEQKALLDIAEALHDEKTARELAVTIIQKEQRALEVALQAKEKEIIAAKAQKTNLIDLAGGYDKLTDSQQNEVDIIDQTIEQKGLEANAIRASIELKKLENAANQEKNELLPLLIAAGYSELELQRMQAIAAGNFALALQLELELRRQKLAMQQQQAAATREVSDAELEAAKSSEKAAKAAKEHEDQLKAAGSAFEAILNGWNDRLSKLGDAAHQAFMAMNKGIGLGTQGLGDFGAGLSEAEKGLRKVQTDLAQLNYAETTAAVGFAKWANTVAAGALQIEQAFYTQTVSAERLSEKLKSLSGNALKQVIQEAELAKEKFSLLDRQALDDLQSEIDDAKNRLVEMQEETQSAKDRLMELNAELLELQGMDEKSKKLKEQLDYQQQLAEIEKQRQAAELSGNRELIATLDEQKRILDAIYQKKLQNIEADAKKAEQNNSENSNISNTNNTTSTKSATGGGTTNVVNNFYIDPTKLASEEWVRKNVMPTLNKVSLWTR